MTLGARLFFLLFFALTGLKVAGGNINTHYETARLAAIATAGKMRRFLKGVPHLLC